MAPERSPMRASLEKLIQILLVLPEEDRIDALNEIREALHQISPLRDHPVDFVRWVRAEEVRGNDYNPNTVAPPEMKLLAHSVEANGYTMPIVTHQDDQGVVVVDGFHRHRVGKEHPRIRQSTLGHLPVTQIRAERSDKAARIAATVEHNRARGDHRVEARGDVVRMLYRAGWRDDKIQEELGMCEDEVRRLKQITGLADLFADREFSQAWEPDGG
jgi:ParB-like chromosome segregation protein Spo0J